MKKRRIMQYGIYSFSSSLTVLTRFMPQPVPPLLCSFSSSKLLLHTAVFKKCYHSRARFHRRKAGLSRFWKQTAADFVPAHFSFLTKKCCRIMLPFRKKAGLYLVKRGKTSYTNVCQGPQTYVRQWKPKQLGASAPCQFLAERVDPWLQMSN